MRIKHIVLFVLVIFLLNFSFQLVRLNDDNKVLDRIREDTRVTYSYIELYDVETMGGVRDTLSFDYGFEYTFFLRRFVAYRDPPDTTLGAENRMILGYVDMNLKVWIIGEMQADVALV